VRDNVGLLLGLFVTIMFSARISGSHFNPCITFSYMIGNVKHGNFDRILGILYIFAQFIGAMIGVIFGLIFSNGKTKGIELHVEAGDGLKQILVEVMGSFFLVFMYLCSTDEKTKFTKDAAIQTIILAGSQLGAMLLAGTLIENLHLSPVNPAISFAIIFLNSFRGDSSSATNWQTSYCFFAASFGGSALALIFFRFVYKKTTEQIEQMDDEEDENNEEALMG